jgi:DNA helicase-2/ATP-dependent DNA helicase PcrA
MPNNVIADIPDEYIEEIRPRIQVSRPIRAPGKRRTPIRPGSEIGVRLGQQVRHDKFGDGVILNCEGQGAHARVEVNFETAGTKWLVLSYANLDLM